MSKDATTYVTSTLREAGSANEQIIKSFKAKAATNYVDGAAVTIDTDGRVVLNVTNDEKIDGFVAGNVDNSEGANDAVTVPVILKGNIWVDCMVGATGDWDDAFEIGTNCGIGGDGGTTAATGAAVVATGTAEDRTLTSLSVQAKPSGGVILRKGLFYFRGSGKFV
jgi:hypothetical protein